MRIKTLFNSLATIAASVGLHYMVAETPAAAEPDVTFKDVMPSVLMMPPDIAQKTASPHSVAFLHFGKSVKPPAGYTDYCNRLPLECVRSDAGMQRIEMTDELEERIKIVNSNLNYVITPMDDEKQYFPKEEHWTFPHALKGDCDDYMLAKIDQLGKIGVPREAMVMVVVRTEDRLENGKKTPGEGHIVLGLFTDKGDILFDNRRDDAMLLSQTGYKPYYAMPLATQEWVRLEKTEPLKPKAPVPKSANAAP